MFPNKSGISSFSIPNKSGISSFSIPKDIWSEIISWLVDPLPKSLVCILFKEIVDNYPLKLNLNQYFIDKSELLPLYKQLSGRFLQGRFSLNIGVYARA